jgi:hypothetical protein
MIRYVLTPTVDQNLTPRQHMALLRQCREMDPGDDYQKVAMASSRTGPEATAGLLPSHTGCGPSPACPSR